jgi:hypothetical protein
MNKVLNVKFVVQSDWLIAFLESFPRWLLLPACHAAAETGELLCACRRLLTAVFLHTVPQRGTIARIVCCRLRAAVRSFLLLLKAYAEERQAQTERSYGDKTSQATLRPAPPKERSLTIESCKSHKHRDLSNDPLPLRTAKFISIEHSVDGGQVGAAITKFSSRHLLRPRSRRTLRKAPSREQLLWLTCAVAGFTPPDTTGSRNATFAINR